MISENRFYDVNEALINLKLNKNKKFIENIEVSVNLSFLPKNKNFVVKGYSVLPYGNAKNNKIAVFSVDNSLFLKSNDDVKLLSEAELMGINKKNLFFDLIITTPASMIKFGKLSKILNAKNLMPDVKYGTITTDINSTLDLFKKNYVRFKSDKGNVINSKIGNIELDDKFLIDNLFIFINDIKKSKPKDCKNLAISSLYLTSTMGSSFKLDIKSLFS
ncbi:MAG TPA: hypothetical protein ACYCC7_01635 [Candidatus Azoamicus sp. MARI]